MTEKELQELLFKLIKDGQLLATIHGIDEIQEATNMGTSEHSLPGFSIDSLLRERYAEGAQVVIDALSCYQLISEEDGIPNISLNRQEKLFPDLVLFNPEKQLLIVIENKVSRQTEREAITELLGYGHEIRNHLPFLSTFEICYVIVSPEFSPLLDHAVAGEVLSTSNKILCLKPSIENNTLLLAVHFPKSWTDVGQDSLPKNALVSYTLLLSNKGGTNEEDDFDPMAILQLAAESIARDGNKNNSSGFYVTFANGLKEFFRFDFGITIYILNPFAFLSNAISKGFAVNKNSSLFKFLTNPESKFTTPNSLFRVADKAIGLLEQHFIVQWERSSNWEADWEDFTFRLTRNPLTFDSWGAVGDFVRYFYFHPGARRHYFDITETKDFGHLKPVVGLQIINMIAGTGLFKFGKFTPTDLFKFGVQLHLQRYAYTNAIELDETKKSSVDAHLFWTNLAVFHSVKEIRIRISETADVDEMAPLPLIFNKEDISEDTLNLIDDFSKWFSETFVPANSLHAEVFLFGFNMGYYFVPALKESIDRTHIEELDNYFSVYIKKFVLRFIDQHKKNEVYLSPSILDMLATEFELTDAKFAEADKAFSRSSDEHIASKLEVMLAMFDDLEGEVFHEIAGFDLRSIQDLTWLEERAQERFSHGLRYTAIEIQSDGSYGIGQLEGPFGFAELNNADEVFVNYHLSGIAVVRRTTWSDIRNGTFKLE